MPHTLRVGLISDTHGLLRPQALVALEGSDRIIHAGDIGDPSILDALREIAPVHAVRGNNDRDDWAVSIAETERLRVGDVEILVIHDLATLTLDPRQAGLQAVIAGHSHRPQVQRRDGVLFVNPGSAGPRRFKLPVSVARLTVSGARLEAELIALAV